MLNKTKKVMEPRRSTRLIKPSLKALEAAETAKSYERHKRVKKLIEAIPDIQMEYVEKQLEHLSTISPFVEQIDHLETILSKFGIN